MLVGGRSRRFGRDKLLEPLGPDGELLVDRPLTALRAVFGPRVAAVGACDPRVAARFDSLIADLDPPRGPLSGVAAALQRAHMHALPSDHPAVFVLSGDLPNISAQAVHAIIDAAAHSPHAWAVLASAEPHQPAPPTHTDPPIEPCIGLYRAAALPALLAALDAGQLALHAAIPAAKRQPVPLPHAVLANVNREVDLLPRPREENGIPISAPPPTPPPAPPPPPRATLA